MKHRQAKRGKWKSHKGIGIVGIWPLNLALGVSHTESSQSGLCSGSGLTIVGPPEPLHCPTSVISAPASLSLHLPQKVRRALTPLPGFWYSAWFSADPVLCHPQKPRHGLESSFVPWAGTFTPWRPLVIFGVLFLWVFFFPLPLTLVFILHF